MQKHAQHTILHTSPQLKGHLNGEKKGFMEDGDDKFKHPRCPCSTSPHKPPCKIAEVICCKAMLFALGIQSQVCIVLQNICFIRVC